MWGNALVLYDFYVSQQPQSNHLAPKPFATVERLSGRDGTTG